MATSVVFNGKVIKLPGVYATIKSGIKNPAVAQDFGNVLIIDTGSGAFFGGGSGISGTLKQGKDSIYSFDNINDFRSFVKGGLWWSLAQPLFLPGGGASSGASSVTMIKAAATVPATINYTFTGGGSNGGTLSIQLKEEGENGNGSLGDETKARSTVTVVDYGDSDASVFGEFITIQVGGKTVATYTVQIGDVIANVVSGLVASAQSLGYVDVISSNTTSFIITALRGSGATVNGTSPTIVAAGGAWATATAFAGGVTGTLLTRGYAGKMIAGVVDTSKFILQVWHGTFKGLDSAISNGDPFDGIAEASTVAELVAQTPEFSNISEIVSWLQTDPVAYNLFNIASTSTFGTGAITTADLVQNISYKLASGGSDTYSTTALNAVLDSISDLNFDFILADKWGDNARSTSNLSILAYITNEAKVKPDLYIAGGKNSTKWSGSVTSSNDMAIAFNSEYVSVVHGGVRRVSPDGTRLKDYDSIVHAAYMVGREAGLQPQIPLTFKAIGIDGELHNLTDKEAVFGLDRGVLMSRISGNTINIIKGVNTLQLNKFLVNTDGSTHSKQLERIKRQLNKELIVNLTDLLKKPDGSNRNTLSVADVKAFVEGYLNTKVATDIQDNLIISYKNVSVTIQQDVMYVTYAVVPNFEVSIILVSGFLLDPATNS